MILSALSALITFSQFRSIANAQDNRIWLLNSTLKDFVSLVDDLREILRQQGIAIDREEIKPFIRELNMAVNELRASLVNLRNSIDRGNISDNAIVAKTSSLASGANNMIFAMENLFNHMSEFDTELERYRNSIYQLATTRGGVIEEIRLITVTPVNGRINRDLLSSQLDTAIEISDQLLPAIQELVTELGSI